ncbi:MAG: AAA family ATPase [Treponema sp.]|nr:AAA family ATPase [Treponema sp.]MBR4385139.1 AAA family ATPase [Treponema sp.]
MNIQQFMPVDIHDFTQLRNKNLIFADKSECIFNLARQEQFVFLARPPMFGKSLLVSFLKNYFEGRRELFLGLKIACLEDAAKNPWTVYPVLSFNFTKFRNLAENSGTGPEAKSTAKPALSAKDEFLSQLREQGEKLNFKVESEDPSLALTSALKQMCSESQKPAVILFDDFLAPAFSSPEAASPAFSEQNKDNIDFLKTITLTVKSAGSNLRFAFFTDSANLSYTESFVYKDISLSPMYKDICGFTHADLTRYFAHEIAMLAATTAVAPQTVLNHLLNNYGGYKFSPASKTTLYNPYDLIRLFGEYKWNHFWVSSIHKRTAKPFIVTDNISLIKKIPMMEFSRKDFLSFRAGKTNLLPFLYSTGIISIKEYNAASEKFRLDFPNQETRDFFTRIVFSANK